MLYLCGTPYKRDQNLLDARPEGSGLSMRGTFEMINTIK
jgi:hypothetical protein